MGRAWALLGSLLSLAVSTRAGGQPDGERPASAPPVQTSGETRRCDSAEPPAEESRLNVLVFREGLRRLGLIEVLELHVREFPPSNPLAVKLLLRDARLAEWGDPRRSLGERRRALFEANRLLEEVIAQSGTDPRRFEWRFTLAHSLIYEEAELHFTNILYRGGTESDREELAARTERALRALDALAEELAAEYERIDRMSVAEFERSESSGHIAAVDALAPRMEYLRLWAWFYDALARREDDPDRLAQLTRVLTSLEREGMLLDTEHAVSHVQVQSLLLAGMAARRIKDPSAARLHLDRCTRAHARLDDEAEKERVAWAAMLARLERVRTEIDDGKSDAAMTELQRLRDQVDRAESSSSFGWILVAALVERDIRRDQAAAFEDSGRSEDGTESRRAAWRALDSVARRSPRHRDELYALISGMVRADAAPASLDPFELCALLAGALQDDGDASDDAADLNRAMSLGTYFLEHMTTEAPELVPEVLFNLSVAEYRQGRLAAAAERLLTLAQDHPESHAAGNAAVLAVELAAELRRDATLGTNEEVSALYHRALEGLVRGRAGSEAAEYWRFHLAQSFEEQGDYGSAAEEYHRVRPEHENGEEAEFRRVDCLGRKVLSEAATRDAMEIRRVAAEFLDHVRVYLQRPTPPGAAPNTGSAPSEASSNRITRLRLLSAEVHMLPALDQAPLALDILDEVGAVVADIPELRARYWKARLTALDRAGRLEEAGKAVPVFVASSPENAGDVLRILYDRIVPEFDQLREHGDTVGAQRRADFLLLLARHIDTWTSERNPPAVPEESAWVALQLAEAYLRAGRFAAAADRFSALASREVDDAFRARRELGLAEAWYQLGKKAEALPVFNRWINRFSEEDARRWQALLRDLQCRTALGQDPRDVLRVIRQQRHLQPALGGDRLRAEFDRLERENQRRQDGKES